MREVAQLLNAMRDAGSVARDEIARLAARHGLSDAWQRFEARFPNEF
jgi:hypothetical protein